MRLGRKHGIFLFSKHWVITEMKICEIGVLLPGNWVQNRARLQNNCIIRHLNLSRTRRYLGMCFVSVHVPLFLYTDVIFFPRRLKIWGGEGGGRAEWMQR